MNKEENFEIKNKIELKIDKTKDKIQEEHIKKREDEKINKIFEEEKDCQKLSDNIENYEN